MYIQTTAFVKHILRINVYTFWLQFFWLNIHRPYCVANPLAGVVFRHRACHVAEQLLGMMQVFGVGGGLGA
ncbi:MAG: hypothetical protein Q8J70_12140, partial [Thiobacillus sp.]|nr:hypothetical protein [Thiobacillus sp.]